MANNIIANQPDMYVPQTGGTPAARGFTALNTRRIYAANGSGGYSSYIPGAGINSLTLLVAGHGILVDPITSREDTDLIGGGAPLPSGGGAALPTPGSPTATAISDTEIDLDWTASAGATRYIVDRATNAGFTTGVALGIYGGSATNFSDSGLTAETQYFYRIAAVASGATNSAYATANATTEATGSGLTQIDFETAVSFSETSPNVWEASADTGRGLSNLSLPTASGTGFIQFQVVDSAANGALLGLNTVNDNSSWSATDAKIGAMRGGNGHLWVSENGTLTDLAVDIADGDYIRLQRVALKIELQTSSDGVTWSADQRPVWNSAPWANTAANVQLFIRGGGLAIGAKVYSPEGDEIT